MSRQMTDKEPMIQLSKVGNSLTIAAVKRKEKVYDVGDMIQIVFRKNQFVVLPLADAKVRLKA